MLLNLLLLQFYRSVPPPVRLVMTYSALIAMSSYQAVEWSSRRESQFSSRQELMDKCALDLDWP